MSDIHTARRAAQASPPGRSECEPPGPQLRARLEAQVRASERARTSPPLSRVRRGPPAGGSRVRPPARGGWPIRTTLALLLAGALLPILSPTLSAQSIPSPYRFLERRQESGPFAGYMTVNAGRFGYGPKGGALAGGRWGYELGGPVSIEGVAGLLTGERDVVDPGRDEGDRVIGQAPVLVSTMDARLKFSLVGQRSWRGISPFLVFGGGVAMDLAGVDELDEELLAADRFEFGSGFFGTLGAGTRIFLTESVAARLDGVFSLWKLDTPPGFSDPERDFEDVESGEWSEGLSLSISFMYRW